MTEAAPRLPSWPPRGSSPWIWIALAVLGGGGLPTAREFLAGDDGTREAVAELAAAVRELREDNRKRSEAIAEAIAKLERATEGDVAAARARAELADGYLRQPRPDVARAREALAPP